MELQVIGKNIDLKPDIRQYIDKKLSKLDRHLNNIKEASIEITVEQTKSPQQRYIAQITFHTNGTIMRSEERANDILKAIDKASAVMDRQIERYKGKRFNKKGSVSIARSAPLSEKLPSEIPVEEAQQVVKIKRFAVRMMSEDEAIEQMELLGHDFFLFLNNGGKLNLLYRRKDKNYGLIEPIIG